MDSRVTLREASQQALEALEYGQHTLKQISENQWESRGQLAMQALRAALAEPGQEPFCFHDGRDVVGKEFAHHEDVFPLYAAPPQRKPLTEDDIALIVADCSASAHRHDDFNFARAIERAHGIGDK